MLQQFIDEQITKTADKAYKQADQLDKDIKKDYQRLAGTIESELALFFSRNSQDGKLQPNQLNTRMTSQELSLFLQKMAVLKATLSSANLSPLLSQQLAILTSVIPVTSLEAFLFLVEAEYLKSQVEIEEKIKENLDKTYEETHNQTLFALSLAVIGINYKKPKAKKGRELANTAWQGASLEQRMAETKAVARSQILKVLNESAQTGKTLPQVAKSVQEVQASSFGRVKRLNQTETARVITEAKADSYEASEVVSKYQIISTLDSRTSKICRKMDGKIFNLKDKQIGVNAPPFHANCRSTDAPYFDEQDLGDRMRKSRKKNGENTFVPATTKYSTWVQE